MDMGPFINLISKLHFKEKKQGPTEATATKDRSRNIRRPKSLHRSEATTTWDARNWSPPKASTSPHVSSLTKQGPVLVEVGDPSGTGLQDADQ